MRRRNGQRKWRRRLLTGLMAGAMLVLAGVAVLAYAAYQRASFELVLERNRQVTYLSAARLKDEMSKYADLLVSVARAPELARVDREARRAALDQARFRLAAFDGGVILLDNFGRVQAVEPARPEILGHDWSGSAVFRELLASQSVYYSAATGDGPEGAQVVMISVPILGANDEFLGALVGMFRLGQSTVSAFYASLVRLRIGLSGNTLLVDGNGQVIYDSGYALLGRQLNPNQLPGFGPQGGAARMRDADGNDVVAAYATVPGTQWTLISEDDWAPAMQPFRRYGNALLILLALAMILPAVGVPLLLREQNAAMLENEHGDQETRVSSLIRERLLPSQVPMLPGWRLAVSYQPASEAGGDFHDFSLLPDGRLMLAVGDVHATGVAGAHLISTARTALRGAARQMLPPADALEYGNGLLCPEVGEGTVVSCLYAVLDPWDGRLIYANAGLTAPFLRRDGDASALNSVGPPLAAVLDSLFTEAEVTIDPGEYLLLCSDGLVAACGPQGEPFGTERVQAILKRQDGSAQAVIEAVVSELRQFTGKRWTQEDDLTVLVVERIRNGDVGGE